MGKDGKSVQTHARRPFNLATVTMTILLFTSAQGQISQNYLRGNDNLSLHQIY